MNKKTIKRITKKINIPYYESEYGENIPYSLLQKLGKIEDIEEEIGIDIPSLFKALKDGIWSKEFWMCESKNCKKEVDHIIPILQYYNNDDGDHWSLDCGDGGYYTVEFKDYGKTWAFTKEELICPKKNKKDE